VAAEASEQTQAALLASRPTLLQRLRHQAIRRLSWGVADQIVSSLTNFVIGIYVIRALGAAQFGAFSLAYVTYGFALNASRGLATDPLMVRFSGTDVPTWRRAVASCTGTAACTGLVRHDRGGLPRPGSDLARPDAAGQLALLVLRARPWWPGVP
jgi:hypothetical protein